MSTYNFVEAENHFVRSEAAAQGIIGSSNAAKALSIAKLQVPGITGFPAAITGSRFGWDPNFQLFWGCELLSHGGLPNHVPWNH